MPDVSERTQDQMPVDMLVSRAEYMLSPEEMDKVEADLFKELQPYLEPGQDIVSVVVPWDSKFAKFGRTSETLAYGDFDNHKEMIKYEDNSFFIYTFDTEHEKIAHVKRILHAKTPEERERTGLTGIEVIDDRTHATSEAEYADLEELIEAHEIGAIEECWNVTSNHRTGRVKEPFLERPYALVSYKAVFELLVDAGVNRLFAYLNAGAINSLAGPNMQIKYQLLGNKEFHLPLPQEPGNYDHDFVATCIPRTPENESKFTKVDESVIGTVLIADREVPIFVVEDTADGTNIVRV